MIGMGEFFIIGGILVLLFGATQIPKIARSIGEGLKEFKKGVRDAKAIDHEDNQEDNQEVNASTNKKSK